MKKISHLSIFSSVIVLAFVIPQIAFAATCTQYGGSTYCTDEKGKTTTYTQYGNNIYGSDGTSYTTYGDTTYGSGNVFYTGGNSGSSLPSLTTAGADLNSPEMKAAWAKYQEACAPSTSSETTYGGTAASNCREAVAEWAQALSNSQRNYVPPPVTQPTNNYSGGSASQNESTDEYMARVLSFLNSMYDAKSENLCVSRGVPNSHQEGNYCICDTGYLNNGNNRCVPLSIESCEALNGHGAIPQQGTNFCRCDTANGYTLDSSRNVCIPSSTITNSNSINPPSVQQIKTESQSVPVIKKKPTDVKIKVEVATSTATSTVSIVASTSTPSSTSPKMSVWRKIFDWFKWW